MIHIVGVNHAFQFINSHTDLVESEQFRSYILRNVQNNKIGCLAEEMNEEWLVTKWNADRCVCREIAKDLGIVHVMCDPNTEERREMGYKTEREIMGENGLTPLDVSEIEAFDSKQWRKREEFWFSKIEPYLTRNILFVCGPNHVFSFSKLLEENGRKTKVICERWLPKQAL